MSKSIKILIVDDHKMIRDGVKFMLKERSDIEIVGECSNGKEALDYLKRFGLPDVILMDINMPVMDGIEATNNIMRLNSKAKVLALTMYAEVDYILKMVRAGVMGYILKEEGQKHLIEAIEAVSKGKKYYSNQVSINIIESMAHHEEPDSSQLSKRESEILKGIVDGNSNGQIAETLQISSRTVESHRRNILKKLNLKNTAEMVKYALENNMFLL